MSTSTLTPVGELAVHHPAASRVFHRHHIDYCCGGKRSLSEVCDKLGLKPEEVLAEIAAEQHRPADHDWSHAPLDELIDFILVHFHEPLKEELPRLVHRPVSLRSCLERLTTDDVAVIESLRDERKTRCLLSFAHIRAPIIDTRPSMHWCVQ